MNRHPLTDGWKIVASVFAGPMALVIGAFVLVGSFAYCAGQRTVRKDLRVAALVDTIRLTDSIVTVRTDTVAKIQRRVDTVKARSDALDSAVVIRDDSTLIVPDTVKDSTRNFNVPPIVIADLKALRLTVATQDTLIHALYGRDSTQEWRIATRDKLIRELSQHHPFACGRKCGIVVGFTAGLLVRKVSK